MVRYVAFFCTSIHITLFGMKGRKMRTKRFITLVVLSLVFYCTGIAAAEGPLPGNYTWKQQGGGISDHDEGTFVFTKKGGKYEAVFNFGGDASNEKYIGAFNQKSRILTLSQKTADFNAVLTATVSPDGMVWQDGKYECNICGNGTWSARYESAAMDAIIENKSEDDFFKGPEKEIEVRINGKRLEGVVDINDRGMFDPKPIKIQAKVELNLNGDETPTASASDKGSRAGKELEACRELQQSCLKLEKGGSIGIIMPSSSPSIKWYREWLKTAKDKGKGIMSIVGYSKGVFLYSCSLEMPSPVGPPLSARAGKPAKLGKYELPGGHTQLAVKYTGGSCQMHLGNSFLVGMIQMAEDQKK
jgi:hypothetical protein